MIDSNNGWAVQNPQHIYADIGSHVHGHSHIITDQMPAQDFVCALGKYGFQIIKNRYNGEPELSTEELVPILCKMLVKNFLKEKMNVFEESLTKELELTIKQTLIK